MSNCLTEPLKPTLSRKLAFALKVLAAVEVGAINAYLGHWKRDSSRNGWALQKILLDECAHLVQLEYLLNADARKPSAILNFVFRNIGKSIGLLCHFRWISTFTLARGAGVIEWAGVLGYRAAIYLATKEKREYIVNQLKIMKKNEEEHQVALSKMRDPFSRF